MDSELTYLNFLRRPEVLNANHNSGIHIVKVGAASTESYQALDGSICFKELAKALADCTLKYDSSKLKASITRLLQQSNEISSHLNSSKRKAIIDAVSIAPECYRRAFTRNNIRDGFASTGEITKISDNSYSPCPNLIQMKTQCKTKWTHDQWEFFMEKLVPCVKEMINHGHISEAWFDQHDFPTDRILNGVEVLKKCSLQQIHLHRAMVLDNKVIRTHFCAAKYSQTQKEQDRLDRKYRLAGSYFNLNTSAEATNSILLHHKQHLAASKLKTKNDRLSRFYSLYPHAEAGKVDGQQGTFQELRQTGAFRFIIANNDRVVDMFEWDSTILTYLEQKEMHGNSLLEKQHRLVCYFLEKLLDLMLGIDQNISSNPGFESFIGYFNTAESM